MLFIFRLEAVKLPIKIHVHLIIIFSIITKYVIITTFNPIGVKTQTFVFSFTQK